MSETTERLHSLTAPILQALARRLGVSNATQKEPIVTALERTLTDDMESVVAQLSETEGLFLREAAYNDGLVQVERFEAKYRLNFSLPPASVYPPSKASMLLLFLGGDHRDRNIPPSMVRALRQALCEPEPPKLKTVDSPPAVLEPPVYFGQKTIRPVHVFESERTAFTELQSVLRLIQAGQIKITEKSGRPTDASVRLIGEALPGGDFLLEPPEERQTEFVETAGAVRAHAWGVLVQQCKWAKPKSGKLVLTRDGQALLGAPDPPKYRSGFEEFVADSEFDEFNRINHIRGQSGKGSHYMTTPSHRRLAIRELMRDWPLDRWIEIEEAYRFLTAAGADFYVSSESYRLYFGEAQYGAFYGKDTDLSIQYLRAFLFESMATLGLIDVAYTYPHWMWPELGECWGADELSFCSRYDGLLYVRLNKLGAYCLGVSDSYVPPARQKTNVFRVLPNREIAVLEERSGNAAELRMLELLAAKKSERIWTLDASRILSYIESGGSIDEVRGFLGDNSSSALPETVETMLADIERKSAAMVRAEEAILIECRDEVTAALITRDTRAAKCCYLAGATSIAVPKRNLRAFRAAAKQLGFVISNDRLPS